jgi:hypothetical protein
MPIRTEFPRYADLLAGLPRRKPGDMLPERYVCPSCWGESLDASYRVTFHYDPDLEAFICLYCLFELWIGHTPRFIRTADAPRFDELRMLIWDKPDFSDRYSFVTVIAVD